MANMKKSFYQAIGDHFLKKSKDVAMAVQSSSCEQWINTEIMIALNSKKHKCLKSGEYAVNEALGKVDVVIFKGKRKFENAKHLIEVKVVYPLGGEKQIENKLNNLYEKLNKISENCNEFCKDIKKKPRIHGLVFTVWHDLYDVNWNQHAKAVKNKMRTIFPNSEYTTQHNYTVESTPFFYVKSILVGEDEREVRIGATLFTMR